MTSNSSQSKETSSWPSHVLRVGTHSYRSDNVPDPQEHHEHVKPWLSALFQAEHLNLLVGNGLTIAIATSAGASIVNMQPIKLEYEYAEAIENAAKESAKRFGHRDPNIEDQIRAVLDLIAGLRILVNNENPDKDKDPLFNKVKDLLPIWESALNDILSSLLDKVLETERGIMHVLGDTTKLEKANHVRRLLGGFLLPFASRTGTRERLHLFTTNYDRLLEYGCDLLGLRIIDRFVGTLAPVFQSSRLGIDLHYNPPGIRGEPRYLEGVVRFTKLHGSLDWRCHSGPSGNIEVQRCALPFGALDDHPEIPKNPGDSVLIYPNPAKDIETLEYPYAELFRDFAAAVCRPNSVVVTYGYGFGDDHVNRILADMLAIPSTHLVIISWDAVGGRLEHFYDRVGRDEQITLLIGNHFGDLETLIKHYLPKPAIDQTTWRMVDLLKRREKPQDGKNDKSGNSEPLDLEISE